jgi:hypothetical protein
LRYPLADETSGQIAAIGVFDHDGLARRDARPGPANAAKLSASLPSPYSFTVIELFKISDGRIAHIDAVLSRIPYGMRSTWTSAP